MMTVFQHPNVQHKQGGITQVILTVLVKNTELIIKMVQ